MSVLEIACSKCGDMWELSGVAPLPHPWTCSNCAPERPWRHETSPEDQMLSDMQEQLQTVRNEKLLAQQELLNSLKSLRDERVRNLDLLRDVIAYQNALKASEESITWYSASVDVLLRYIDRDLQLHELQNTRWARFKRWMKEQWESEVAL